MGGREVLRQGRGGQGRAVPCHSPRGRSGGNLKPRCPLGGEEVSIWDNRVCFSLQSSMSPMSFSQPQNYGVGTVEGEQAGQSGRCAGPSSTTRCGGAPAQPPTALKHLTGPFKEVREGIYTKL